MEGTHMKRFNEIEEIVLLEKSLLETCKKENPGKDKYGLLLRRF